MSLPFGTQADTFSALIFSRIHSHHTARLMSSHKLCTSALLLPFASSPFFCPSLLRSISQCAYATHQAVSFLNRLFFLPSLKIKNKPTLSPFDVPDPCAYCIGRLPLLPVVATLRLPPSLNSRSARAHNFRNTPSSYVFPRFYPTLAQGCFPFYWLKGFSSFLRQLKQKKSNSRFDNLVNGQFLTDVLSFFL